MSADWHLYVTIGTDADYYAGRTYLALEADPLPAVDPAAAPVLPKLLSATWRHLLADDGSWPAIQGPSTGSVSIVFATAAEAAEVRAGAPITLRLWHPVTGATAPVSMFSGRISSPQLQPHRLGVIATFGLSDHLAPLAEETVGEDDYATGVTQYGMLAGLFTEAGLNPPDPPGALELVYGALRGRDPEPASLLTLAQETVAAALMIGPDDVHRLYELRPNLHPSLGDLDPDEPYILSPLPREAEDSEATLAAGHILADGTWTRSLFTDINTVHIISGDKIVARANNRLPGEPAVTTRRPSAALSGGTTADLAAYLLPEPEWVPGWEAETFTVPLEKLDAGSWPGQLRDVLTVTDIPVEHNPNGTTEWTGVITGIETRIASLGPGRPRVEIGLTLSDRPTAAPYVPPPPPTWVDEVTADTPLSWYRLDDTETGVLTDTVGGQHGTCAVTGDVAGLLVDDPDHGYSPATGNAQVADSAYLDVLLAPPGLTVEVLLNSTTQVSGDVMLVGRTSTIIEWQLTLNSGRPRFTLRNSGGTFFFATAVSPVSLNVPHHVAVTWPGIGGTARVYLDGVEVATVATSGSGVTNQANAPLRIGSASGSLRFVGTLDEVALYSGALTPERIAAHHVAAFQLA